MLLRDSIIQVRIVNNRDFEYYFSSDCRVKIKVIKINKDFLCPNEIGVKYFHLLPKFSYDPILGYKFDAVSNQKVFLSYLGMNTNLYEIRIQPKIPSYGPLDGEAVRELEKINVNIIL